MFTFRTRENRQETITPHLLGNGSCLLHWPLTSPWLLWKHVMRGIAFACLSGMSHWQKPVDPGQSDAAKRTRSGRHRFTRCNLSFPFDVMTSRYLSICQFHFFFLNFFFSSHYFSWVSAIVTPVWLSVTVTQVKWSWQHIITAQRSLPPLILCKKEVIRE